MNIGEYINERLADVRFYLRGINYNKLDSERAVEGLREDVSGFFNDNPLYRSETDKLVRDIKGMYDTLKDHELEFATTKVEVDNSISKFERNLKQRIVEFKNKILLLFQQNTNCQSALINNSMDDVNVRVRTRNPKKTMEEMHEMKELFGLRESFIIIYIFITYISDKSCKIGNFLDNVNENVIQKTSEYQQALRYYMQLLNEKDYEKFIDLYDEKTNELFGENARVRGKL